MKLSQTSRPVLSVLIFTLTATCLRADEALTLDRALNEAMLNNPTILAAQSQVDAVSAKILPSYLWPDPSFEVMWMNLPAGSLDPSEAGMRQYAVSQMIPFPGKRIAQGAGTVAQRDVVQASSGALVSKTLADVERAYWTVYRVSRDKAILAESLVLLNQLLASARSRYATGTAPQAEVLRAQLARSELEVRLVSLAEKLGAAKVKLALLLGRNHDNLPTLPGNISIEFLSDDFPPVDSTPMVQASQAKVRASNRRLTGAWLALSPDFMAAYRWREADGDVGSGDIMIGVILPVWVWPRASNGIAQASAERKAAVYENQAVINQVEIMYAKLSAKLNSSRIEIERIQQEVLPLAEQALASSRIAYETGAVEFNSLLDAERSWRSARMNLERARFDYQIALADLWALMGEYLQGSKE